MPELLATLEAYNDRLWEERKFLAAIQGIDLDKEVGSSESDPIRRVSAAIAERLSITADTNDITSLKGRSAASAGFGIGEGLAYEVVK